MATVLLDKLQLIDTVRRLAPDERRILLSLKDKGPGLQIEVAVRVLKFPEDVSGPLQSLYDQGLVQSDAFSADQFGGNLFRLTDRGEQVVAVLKDRATMREVDAGEGQADAGARAAQAVPTAQTLTKDPRERQVELLQQLADLARKSGDLAKATQLTQQALEINQTLIESVPTH